MSSALLDRNIESTHFGHTKFPFNLFSTKIAPRPAVFVTEHSRGFIASGDSQQRGECATRVEEGYHENHISRGGHSYMHCTDTRDRDQNLIGPILGLDRLIPARKLP